ncbi:unnamed protein product [Chilo suppressalis]|uniref:FLYWCH-type domain-containing protein n=1 Tax=Chilo suppressalis TaxID=168631 RepID=A0ABN8AWW1_CHISP|nr:unnamed protein product [Chilo suppressalis]
MKPGSGSKESFTHLDKVPGDDSTQPDSSDCEHEKPVQLKKDLDPKFSKSTHGNPIILLDGYKFRLKRDSRVVKSLNVRWVCSTMKHGCKAKLMTVENVVVAYDNTDVDGLCPQIAAHQKKYSETSLPTDDGKNTKIDYQSINNIAHLCFSTAYSNEICMLVNAYSVSLHRAVKAKGKNVMCVDGYRFSVVKGKNKLSNRVRWRCSTHRGSGCTALMHTVGDCVVYLRNDHIHPPTNFPKYSIRYEFTESLRGCRIILIEGYRFAIKNMSKVNAPIKKIQWTCSTHGKHGCDITFLQNQRGNPVIQLNGYYYTKHMTVRLKDSEYTKEDPYLDHTMCAATGISTITDINTQLGAGISQSTAGINKCALSRLKGNSFFSTATNFQSNVVILMLYSYVLQFVTSQRGKLMIKLDGFTYRRATFSNNKVRWTCSTHQYKGCRAFLITLNDEIIYSNTIHEHK